MKPYTSFIRCVAFISIGTILSAVSPTLAQESAFVAAVLKDAGQDLDKLNRIIEDHERLIREYPKAEFAATVMLQLAELHERRSTLLYQKAMAIYEKELDAYDKKLRPDEPTMPRISLLASMDYCYRLLKEYPDLPFKDKIYYRLGMAHLQEMNPVRAQTFFQQLITEYPGSAINLEAHFRIGEYYFDRRDHRQAIEQYKFLLGHWDNPYFDIALYKMGWCYYNLTDYSNAITTFIYLLEDIDLVEKTDSRVIGKSKADLKSESVQYIASCYSEFGGPKSARTFFEGRAEKYYTLPVLTKLAELYQKRNYYSEAIETYDVILDLFPFHENAPDLYKRMVENHELDGHIEEANKTREKMVDVFGPGGRWITHYPEGERFRSANLLAQETLLYLGTFYQTQAQKRNQSRDYLLAIRRYEEFLSKFPSAQDAPRVQYYLAECFYSQGKFKEAAEAYHQVVTEYDSSGYREEAAYNRVLCSYQHMGSEPTQDSITVYIDEFVGSGEVLIVNVMRPSEAEVLRACNDFSRLFPASQWFEPVMMKFGEVLHELKEFLPAITVYKKVVANGESRPFYLLAAINAGQCYFEAGQFEQADVWFSALAKNFPDSTQYADKALKMAGAAKFKLAENLSRQSKPEESAQLLQTVARESKDSQMRSRALFEAGLQFQKAGRDTLAAQSFEELARQEPLSELADQALYRAAGLREQHNDWPMAASLYTSLATFYPHSPMAATSLKNAANCYELMQNWPGARNIYEKFIAQFPDTAEEVIECTYKCGEMSFKAGQFPAARQSYIQTIATYRKFIASGKEVDAYFAAQAQFMLGELEFEEYKTINLTSGKEITLKRKKFQQVFKAYRDALEFQVADWSTAASYRIGMALEEFVRALMDSPLPPGLQGDALVAYQVKLKETARPYQERALDTYAKTVDQAHLNQVDNIWVGNCRQRMQALIEELGYQPQNNQEPAAQNAHGTNQ
jgi:cellulose synthase operon protein C